MEVRLLGSLEAADTGGVAVLGGPKQRAVLALLALDPGRVVSTDQLVESVWGDAVGAKARRTLQVYVSNLRKALEETAPGAGGLLRLEGAGYVLDVEPDAVDCVRFERFAGEGRELLAAGDPDRALGRIEQGLSLWRGPALAEFAYESWAQPHINRFNEAHALCTEDRVDALLLLGRHAELIGELEALINQHPLRERLRGQLILALYRSGRQADALAAYHAARETLLEELGVDPSPPLQALNRQVLTQDVALAAPTRIAAPPRASRLPIPPSPLIGRERALAEVVALVKDDGTRLVTLTGLGGIGKTRLSIEVGVRTEGWFSDGVFWAPMADTQDVGLALASIVAAIGADEQPGVSPVDVVGSRLAETRTLVVIDNAEHLLPGSGSVSL